ncbi:MAG: PepSY-associated TM helix domain-containing protein [Methylovulum sp.]|nr:PepSY-associated TM helix domain-containing protein [Methylovulum sp.]
MHIPTRQLPARAAWLKIHLYLALTGGFFFALIGLSGSLSVYREELDELLNPQLLIKAPQDPSGHDLKYPSLDNIMAAVQAAHPKRYGAWTLEMPQSPERAVTVWYEKPQETYFEYYAPLMVSVNPYTAEVVANRYWGQTAMTWLLDLHTQLRLDRLGWNLVGLLGGLLMISIGTGLYLWWPAKGQYRQAFSIRHNAGMIRFAVDVHRLVGFLSAVTLLLLAFTGLQLSYPKALETLLGSPDVGHGNSGPAILSTARPNNRPVRLEEAEFIARGPFPHAALRRITTPVGDTGTYRVNLRQGGEINQKHPMTMVWIDRWSGHIKEVRDPGAFSWGTTLTTWMWPLHTGEAFGATGRLLWFITGLCPALLYISGLLRWLHRHGMVHDRPIQLSALRPAIQNFQKQLCRIGLTLLKLLVRLAKKAGQYAPVVKAKALLWLRRIQQHPIANRK